MRCHFCSTETARPVNTPHWVGTREDGHWERVDVCGGCRDQVRAYPRKPRAKRAKPTMVPATDWNYLVAFSGRGR